MARRKSAVKNRPGVPSSNKRTSTRQRKAPKPEWDSKTATLFYQDAPVLEIHRRGSNQWKLIEAFAQAGWPEHLNDPLSEIEKEWRSSERLVQTVKDLDRKLKRKPLHFRVDADRLSVRWEVVKKRR